ncbi:MAG: inositol monophosphatase [Chloroflexi bacterium]|nr:inositol monophosphatase [Chloroflexota bacterium]
MNHFTKFAIEVAQAAGQLLLDHHGRMQTLEFKLRTNFKTQVDDLSDRLIRSAIIGNFPGHSILSEEQDARLQDSEFTWVVDPLDGTVPYSYGTSDHFGVSIALLQGREPILGVTFAPLRRELYVAERGGGASCNGRPLEVSRVDDLNRALMAADCGKLERESLIPYQQRLLAADGVVYVMSLCCASVSMAFAASGALDGYLAVKQEPWDIAAGALLVREAGGVVTAPEGRPWQFGDDCLLAAGPELHPQLVRLLSTG